MFTCVICKKDSKPGKKAFPQVLERRAVTYPASPNARVGDPKPTGWEIVKQVNACEKCDAEARKAEREARAV